MQRYRVEITGSAEADINDIFEFMASDNKRAAFKWVEEIEDQIDSLEKFPLRCAIIPEALELGEKYRHIIHGNYRTIFRIEGPRVIIMRVFHSARLLDLELFKK